MKENAEENARRKCKKYESLKLELNNTPYKRLIYVLNFSKINANF